MTHAFDKYADSEAVVAAGGDVSDEEIPDDDDDDDDDEDQVINPFRLLGIDAEGESQYGSGDIDDGGAGRFKMKGLDGKGARPQAISGGAAVGAWRRCFSRRMTSRRARRGRARRRGDRENRLLDE